MNEEIKPKLSSSEMGQEKPLPAEQLDTNRELTKIELITTTVQAMAEVDDSANKIIASADQRIANAASSTGLDSEEGVKIFEQGGFSRQVSTIKGKMLELVSSTNEEIFSVGIPEEPPTPALSSNGVAIQVEKVSSSQENEASEKEFGEKYARATEALRVLYSIVRQVHTSGRSERFAEDIGKKLVDININKKAIQEALNREEFAPHILEELEFLTRPKPRYAIQEHGPSYLWSIRYTILKIVEENLETIEAKIPSSESSLKIIEHMTEEGDPEQKTAGIDIIGRHINEYEKLDAHRHGKALELFLLFGKEKEIAYASRTADVLLERASSDPKDTAVIAAALYESQQEGVAREKGKEMITKILEGFGLNTEEILSAWRVGCGGPSEMEQIVALNLQALYELETAKKGAAQFLDREFGIKDFARYPVELLVRQCEAFDDSELPYGIVIFPHEDHNGTFYRDGHSTLKELFEQLQEKGEIRIFECKNVFDVESALVRLDEKHGNRQKIAFAIFGGHGTETSIDLGGKGYGHELRIEDFSGQGTLGRCKQFFKENPTIILSSCNTGVERGIGQMISEKLGAKVISPNGSTFIKSLKVNVSEGGRFDFDVIYRHVAKKVYSRGKEVKQ